VALRAVRSTELCDHGFESVFFEPGSEGSEVRGCEGRALEVPTREIGVKVFMNIKCWVCEWWSDIWKVRSIPVLFKGSFSLYNQSLDGSSPCELVVQA